VIILTTNSIRLGGLALEFNDLMKGLKVDDAKIEDEKLNLNGLILDIEIEEVEGFECLQLKLSGIAIVTMPITSETNLASLLWGYVCGAGT
jgi:hypothetical protein